MSWSSIHILQIFKCFQAKCKTNGSNRSKVQNQRKQWVNQVPVIGFNSGKYDLNMAKEYFVKKISYNKEEECNENVFARKK